MPKVSIVIPTYNNIDSIDRCIQSCVAQTLQGIEIVIVDDCSNDGTTESLYKVYRGDLRVRLLRSPTNKSASIARKRGVLAAKGKYIMFLDADDELAHNACETAFNAIEKLKVDIVQFGVNVRAVQATPGQKKWMDEFLRPKQAGRITGGLLKKCFADKTFGFTLWNKIYRANLVKLASFSVPDEPIYKAQDLLLQFFIQMHALTYDSVDDKLYTYSYGTGITGGSSFCQAKLTKHMSQARVAAIIYESLSSRQLLTRSMYTESLNAVVTALLEDNLATLGFCRGSELERQSKEIFLDYWGNGEKRYSRYNSKAFSDYLQLTYGELKPEKGLTLLRPKISIEDQREEVHALIRKLTHDYEQDPLNTIPVVMAVNESYIPYMAVAIESIKANSKSNVHIFVLHSAISSKSIERIKKLSSPTLCIEFANITPFINEQDLYSRAHYSIEMYYRLIIAELFASIPKVLYLDSDIVVLEDLRSLYHFEIGDCILAAAKNPVHKWMRQYLQDKLRFDANKYFNSGVILINTKQFSLSNIKEKCLDILRSSGELACPDQDVLNITCHGRVRYLDQCWNFQWHHALNSRAGLPIAALSDEDETAYNSANDNIKILHYTSNIKPWSSPDEPLATHFWSYAKQSPFFMDILEASIISH